MKKYILIILLLILGTIAYHKYSNKSLPHFSKEVTNGVTILNLSGSYKQMGIEFGLLESHELATYYQNLMANPQIIDMKNTKNLKAAIYLYYKLPENFKDYFKGVAEGSGLSLLQILRISASLPLSYVSSCSALLTDAKVNINHHNIIVRNLDARQNIINLIPVNSRVIVSIMNKQTTLIGSLINLPAATIINKNRILLEANNGMMSYKNAIYKNQFNLVIMNQAALEFSDFPEIEDYLLHNLPSTAYISGIISPSQTAYLEISPIKAQVGIQGIDKHIITYTNFFEDKLFAQQPEYNLNNDSKTQAERRYVNLVIQTKKYKYEKNHKFTSNDLKTIITTPINQGGPFAEPGMKAISNPDITVYSIYYDADLNQLSIYPEITHQWVNILI